MLRLLVCALTLSLLVGCGGKPDIDDITIKEIEITTNDYTYKALTAGPEDGTPVILLHGFAATAFQYNEVIRILGAAGYYAVAYTQRGYSPEARPETIEEYRLEHISQDVIDVADSLGLYRFHLVGHDYGAMVTWAASARFSDRIITAAPLSVPHPRAFIQAYFNPDSDQRARSEYSQDFVSPDFENVLLADDAAWLRDFYSPISESYSEKYLEEVGNPEALRAGLRWYHAADWSWNLALGPITMPTLFIWSTEDPYIAPEGAYATGDFIDGEYTFEEWEGVSHFIPEERPVLLGLTLLQHFSGRY